MKQRKRAVAVPKARRVAPPYMATWPDVPERPAEFPDNALTFWGKGDDRRLWEATRHDSRVFIAEGPVAGPLIARWEDFATPQEADQALFGAELEQMRRGFRPPHVNKERFWDPTPIPTAPESFDGHVTADRTELSGYVVDGRFEADLETLIAENFVDGANFPAKARGGFVGDIAHLPEPNRGALLHLWDLGAAGKLRDLAFDWTLGYRLNEFTRQELLENFDGQDWMADLAEASMEVFHDGGLAQYCVVPDGVRVFCNEWYWEDVLCESVDVLVWLALHLRAAEDETFAPEAYEAALRNLEIFSSDFEL